MADLINYISTVIFFLVFHYFCAHLIYFTIQYQHAPKHVCMLITTYLLSSPLEGLLTAIATFLTSLSNMVSCVV